MTRVDRYLLRELVGPFLAGIALATLLILALQLQNQVGELVKNPAGRALALERVLYSLPSVVSLSMPVATVLAVSLAVNRLARDNEVTVLRGTGLRLVRLFLPLSVVGALLAVTNFWLADRVVPEASRRAARLPGSGLVELRTGALVDAETRTLVYFGGAQRLDAQRQALTELLVVRRDTLTTAPRGEYGDRTLTLRDAIVHRYDSRGFVRDEARHGALTLRLTLDFTQTVSLLGNDLSGLSFDELSRLAGAARRQGDRGRFVELETARWFKVGLPTLCLAFALCAPPLSLRFARAGGFAGVLLSVVTVFVGWNTHLFLQAVSLGGWFPPVACAFATHALFVGAGLLLLRGLE